MQNPTTRLKILLPEGSSLSSRQAISALGPLGYTIDICTPDPHCLSRFSRYVRAFYKSPPFGADPEAYLKFLFDRLRQERYDVLLPVQEQAFLFSRMQDQLRPLVGLALSPFKSFEVLQSKVKFIQLLDELALPHPSTHFVRTTNELEAASEYPYYLKTEYGTASRGVWKVENSQERATVIQTLQMQELLQGDTAFLIQQLAPGVLEVAQLIFDRGNLVAFHTWQQQKAGAGGGSCSKQSVERPLVRQHLELLGHALGWHGSLAVDYLYDQSSTTPRYIDANPRLIEVMNAVYSGQNQAEMLVKLSLGEKLEASLPPLKHAKTHMLMLDLLGIAQEKGSRLDLLKETGQALARRGIFKNSREELTPVTADPLSLVPLLLVFSQLLVNPRAVERISTKAVENYALSPKAVQSILADSFTTTLTGRPFNFGGK